MKNLMMAIALALVVGLGAIWSEPARAAGAGGTLVPAPIVGEAGKAEPVHYRRRHRHHYRYSYRPRVYFSYGYPRYYAYRPYFRPYYRHYNYRPYYRRHYRHW